MHILCMILLTLLLLPLPAWSGDIPLFFIQRSKNANEVHYRLQVDDHCRLISDAPVSAIWKLWEKNPAHTKPLTGFDRLAYGVVDQHVTENWVSFHLRPLKARRIKATAIYQPATQTCAPIVHIEMHAQWAALERIYVHADEGLFKPKVVYIDLFGKTLESTPQPMTERIHP